MNCTQKLDIKDPTFRVLFKIPYRIEFLINIFSSFNSEIEKKVK